MERKKKHLLVGISFLIVSIFVLYFSISYIKGNFKDLWPAILLFFGTILYVIYFSTRKKKNRLFIIFLATFIAISSIPLFILTFTSSDNINLLWPAFVLALGLGTLSVYFYGKKQKFLLITSSIIIIAPILVWIFYSIQSKFGLIIGVILFIVGVAFLTRGLLREAKPAMQAQVSSNETEDKEAQAKNERKEE